jgi:uncharacterized protein (TIGR00251 family)
MSALRVTERDGAVRFGVRVQPRSSRPGVDGLHGETLRIRVQAAPVDGAANEGVIAVLAEALGVPRRAIRIEAGVTSRSKVVEVAGVSRAAVEGLVG